MRRRRLESGTVVGAEATNAKCPTFELLTSPAV